MLCGMAEFASLTQFIASLSDEIASLAPERRAVLERYAAWVAAAWQAGSRKMNFICTHNSRRSHLTQIWAQTAAAHYGWDGLETFSGGTEATAFDRRAVAALRRVGFVIEEGGAAENPRYRVHGLPGQPVLECFSKVYNESPNPAEDYLAVMTCSSADQGCPVVFGAKDRFALTYEDPKIADGTPRETEVYDARCRQIATEAMFAWARISAQGA